VPEENFWPLWIPHFVQAGCPSCHPTNSVKALKAEQITTLNILSDMIHRSSLALSAEETAKYGNDAKK